MSDDAASRSRCRDGGGIAGCGSIHYRESVGTEERILWGYTVGESGDIPYNGEVKVQSPGPDEGETWAVSKLLEPTIFAYSSLVKLDCQNVGLMFEQGLESEKMIFARFSIGWLTDGQDLPDCG